MTPRIPISAIFAGLFAASAQGQPAIDRIDSFIERVMSLGYNPGLAVAVVKASEPLLIEGYGMIDADGRKAGADTRFYIASATKSLTGMAAARLVHQKRLELEAPLSHYLPSVRPPAELPAERFTIDALLTHRHGMENFPLIVRTAYSGLHDRETLIGMVPRSELRGDGSFRYTNVGYNLIGMALAEIEHTEDWRGAVEALVTEPLGMSQTTAYFSRVPEDRLALPFDDDLQGGLIRMPMLKSDRTLHAAGGHFMSARDAAIWLEANLTQGRVEGEQRLPAAVFEIAHRKRVDADRDFGRYHRHGYALGWYHADYEGELLMHHFGGFAGYRSHISFMPEHGIGVAVFTNTSGAGFGTVDLIANFVYDLLRDVPELDARYDRRIAELTANVDEQWARTRTHREERAQRKDHLSRPLDVYAGRYRSDAFGEMEITVAEQRLHFRHGPLESLSEPFEQPESARVELVPGSGMVVQFVVEDDEVAALEMGGARWERVAESTAE